MTEIAKKSNKIVDLPGGNKNNIVYIIRVEEPNNIRYFVSSKVDKFNSYIEFIGYETNKTNINKIKDYTDALSIVNKGNTRLIHIVFPWNNVMSVENISYKQSM